MSDDHSVENIGEIRWKLCLCLLLAWVLVVLFVSKGIQSTGKVGVAWRWDNTAIRTRSRIITLHPLSKSKI